MKVTLVTSTKNPVELMMFVHSLMTCRHSYNSVDKYMAALESFYGNDLDRLKDQFVNHLFLTPHKTVMEFVSTSWIIEGVSRSLQQQLTRTWTASFCIRSMRVVSSDLFATDGEYHVPNAISRDSRLDELYKKFMISAELCYNDLIASGAPVEDARSVLPMSIHSSIAASMNLRTLVHFCNSRLCYLAQGEIRELAATMQERVKEEIDKRLNKLFVPPCVEMDFCPMSVQCKELGKRYEKASAYGSDTILSGWLKMKSM